MATANTYTGLLPNYKDQYSDQNSKFNKLKEKLKGQNKPIRKCECKNYKCKCDQIEEIKK